MPQTKKRKREYMKGFMRKIRQKLRIKKRIERDKEIEEQIRRGNINYGLNLKKIPFMSFETYKKKFPDANFDDYFHAKEVYGIKQNRKVAKIPENQSIKPIGFDLWHGAEKEAEKIKEELEEANRFEEFLAEPEHNPQTTEKYDWKSDLEGKIDSISPKKSKKPSEDSENED